MEIVENQVDNSFGGSSSSSSSPTISTNSTTGCFL